ncbi:DUF4288 domain-containing protein [Dictyobacter arantiisoli]|uniref:DUF4288 domain-containing protein n=1 Tax=Dictyobacter arantiisoli TaxID=2014874 RepID=A0A5A5TIB9_9CHLR|nr:DUF4288 domain-containing protein [Dictyobacter arantiisoli]GCF11147.1 hypothetical protein KDI_47110 [Dictyobacter arantiisoli]
MAYSSKNVKWYLAELVEEIETEGESENVVHNNLVLIRADSPEEAYAKAMARGQELNDDYDNAEGQQVTVTFRGLSDLNPILDELEDGTEIAYEELRGLSAADIAEMVPDKATLGVFQAMEFETADSDSSRALLEEAMRIIRNAENEAQ